MQSEVLEVVRDLDSVTGTHLSFGVRTPHRTYWFQSCSVRDRARWVDALQAFAPPPGAASGSSPRPASSP
jgi:hypothetical protein